MKQASFRSFGDAISRKWTALPTVSRLYIGSLLLIPLALLVSFIPGAGAVAGSLSIGAISGMSGAVLWDCYRWFLPRKDSFLLKFLLAILAIVAAAVAAALSKGLISAATGQDPQYYGSSVAFLAPFAFIPFLALALLITGTVGILWVMLVGVVETASPKADLDIGPPILIARMLGIIGLMAGATTLLATDSWFNRNMKVMAAQAALQMDMYPDSSCSSRKDDRFLRINDAIVILGRATNSAPQFIRIGCPLAPQLVGSLAPTSPP